MYELMHTIEIKPLSVNEAYTGRRFKTKKYKQYIKDAKWLFPKKSKVEIFDKMFISVIFGFTNAAADLDNPYKQFSDIISKLYGFNDKNVWKMTLEKIISDKPFIKFKIEKYDDSSNSEL